MPVKYGYIPVYKPHLDRYVMEYGPYYEYDDKDMKAMEPIVKGTVDFVKTLGEFLWFGSKGLAKEYWSLAQRSTIYLEKGVWYERNPNQDLQTAFGVGGRPESD